MAQSVDTKIVELKFNNDNFAEKVDSTLTKLQNLNKAIDEDGLGNALKNLGKNAKQVDMKGVTKGVEEASKGFSKLEIAGITALANISNAAVNLGKRLMSKLISPLTQGIMQGGLSRARNIEQATFQFEGLKIQKSDPTLSYYKEVMDAVLGTSYSYDVAAKAASQLAASNIGVKNTTRQLADGTKITSKVMTGDMTKALLGIAGVASMTGSDFDSMAQIFTRVAGQGKVMAMDLNSIASRGLNAAAVLADSMHKTEAEIRDMVSKGKISFDDFSKAMSDAYGAHAKDSTLMFQGALDDVNAALARIGADFYGPALKAGRDILNSVTPVVDAIHGKLEPALAKSESFMGKASKSLSQYLDILAYMIERFPKGKEAMSDWIAEHMNAWTNISDLYGRGNFKNAVDGLNDFMAKVDGMGGQGIDGWKMLADYLNKDVDAVKKLADEGKIGFNDFYKAFRQLWSQSDKLTNLVGITTVFDNYVRSCIRAEEPTARFNKHIEVFFSIIKGSQSILQSFGTIIGGLVDIFATLAQHLAPLGHLLVDAAATTANFVVYIADFIATSKSFSTVIDGVVSLINKLFELVNVSKIAGLALAGIGKAFDFVVKAVEKVDEGLKKVFEAIHNVLNRIIDKIHEIVTNTELLKSIFEDLKHAGMIVAIVNIIGAIAKPMQMLTAIGDAFKNVGNSFSTMIKNISNIFSTLAGMVGKIGKLIDEITNAIKRMQELLIATAILEIAVAIGVLAGSFYLLSKVKAEGIKDILPVMLSFASVLGGLLAAGQTLKKLTTVKKIWEKSVDSIKGVGLAMIEFAAAIAIVAGSVYLLSKIDKKQLLYATGAIEVLMITMMAMAKALSVTTTKESGLKALWSGKKTSTSITKGLMGLVAMAEAIKIVSKALVGIATIQDQAQIYYALGAIEALMWSMVGITKILSGKEATKMTKGIGSLIALAIAVKLLAKPVMEFASIDPDSMTQGILGVTFLVGALGGLVKLVSGAQGVIKAAAGILIVSFAIQKLADVVLVFSSLDGEGLVKGLGSVIGLIFGLGVALAIIPPEGIIAKAAAFIVLALSLKTLSETMLSVGANFDDAFRGLAALSYLLIALYGAIVIFNKAPVGGILKLFGTLALGALTVVAFGAAIGVFGVGLGVFGVGLEVLAKGVAAVGEVAPQLIAIMITFAVAIGILSSVGLPASGVILALSIAFLMLGGGFALIGSGLDAVAGAIKVMTDLKGELAGTAKSIAEFVAKLSKLSKETSKAGEGFDAIAQPLEKIKDVAAEVTKSIKNLSKQYTDMLSQTATSMQTLSNALTQMTSLNETTMNKSITLISSFIEKLKGVSTDAQVINDLGTTISTAMGNIDTAIQGVVNTLSTFYTSTISQFTAIGQAIQSIADPIQVLESMRSTLGTLAGTIVDFVNTLGTIKESAGLVKEGATEIKNSLTELSDAATAMKQSFGDLTSATATVLGNIGSALKDIADGAKGMVAVKDNLDGASKAFANFYKSLSNLSGTAASVAQGTNTMSAAVRGLGNAAAKAASLSKKGMVASGKEIATSMAKGVTSGKKDVSTAVTNIIDYAAKQAKNKKKTFESVGKNLIAGMVSGIRSQQGALEAEVRKLEAKAERAVKAKAKIKSPSRVWMKIGAYMGEGLAIGISNSASEVTTASRGLASVSEDAVASAIAAINSAVDDDFNDGPVITPIVDLTNIDKSAGYVQDQFGAFGLNANYGNGLARSINRRVQNGGSLESTLNDLASQLGAMTDSMNSRQLVNNIHIEGSEDPDAFADRLTRRFRLNARTI